MLVPRLSCRYMFIDTVSGSETNRLEPAWRVRISTSEWREGFPWIMRLWCRGESEIAASPCGFLAMTSTSLGAPVLKGWIMDFNTVVGGMVARNHQCGDASTVGRPVFSALKECRYVPERKHNRPLLLPFHALPRLRPISRISARSPGG